MTHDLTRLQTARERLIQDAAKLKGQEEVRTP